MCPLHANWLIRSSWTRWRSSVKQLRELWKSEFLPAIKSKIEAVKVQLHSQNIFKILGRHSHYCYAVNRGYHFCLPDEWLKLAVTSCLRSWIKWLFDVWNVSIFCTSVFVSMSKYYFLSLTIKLKTFSRGEDCAELVYVIQNSHSRQFDNVNYYSYLSTCASIQSIQCGHFQSFRLRTRSPRI